MVQSGQNSLLQSHLQFNTLQTRVSTQRQQAAPSAGDEPEEKYGDPADLLQMANS